MASWSDVPHLSEKDKADMLASYPPYQRDARSKGIPQLGSGAVYQVPESEISVKPFPIPSHWYRSYGMDVGWNRTAVVWSAWDRETGTVYLYSEHYRADAEPAVHAAAIRARGTWIPGVIDPAARGRSQADGKQLIQIYRDLGLDLQPADNSVEAGISAIWQRLSAGQLKVFSNLDNFWREYRMYRRDEKGRIVKENDHLLDSLRYDIMSGLDRAVPKPLEMQIRSVRTIASEAGY